MNNKINKIKILKLKLADLKLVSESNQVNSLLFFNKKARTTDEDLSGKADWYSKSPDERKKIMDAKLSNEQILEMTHIILDSIGLVPGIGDVADLTNAIIYSTEGKYGLAAISLLCLIPAIGTAVGIAKKSGAALPAKVIYEHADEIEKIIIVAEKEIPNGNKVSEAVKKILSDVKMGAKGIDLSTGIAKIFENVTDVVAPAATKATTPTVAKWYLNPRWKTWLSSLIEPNLIKILNEISEREARNRLAKVLTQKNVKVIKSIREGGINAASVDVLLRENAQMAKFVSDNFAYIIQDLKKNMRYRIISNPADIAKFTSNPNTLAHADSVSKEIVFFLPNFESLVSKPSEIIEALTNTIRHETWHIIDSRLASIFVKIEGAFLSELDYLSDAFKIIAENLNSSVVSKEFGEYMKNPAELFVRIKELRRFIGKNILTAEDLKIFAVKSETSVPYDLRELHRMMQRPKNWRITYDKLAGAMNEVL